MYVDPDVRSLLDAADPDAPDFWELTPQEARAAMEAMVPAMLPVVDLAEVRDLQIPSADGDVSARFYRAPGDDPAPLLVFYHGGGWEIGSVDVSDRSIRRLARDSGVSVISVDYRLAPEHPFPAGLDDCYAATVWAAANAADLGCDPSFLAVGGDSAGGNLAGAVAQMARDRGEVRIDHQLLVYPVVTPDFESSSYQSFGVGHFLTKATMESFWNLYIGAGPAPLYADLLAAESLAGLPEATVITCGLDVLSAEGMLYAHLLGEADVPVTSLHIGGLIHGIWTLDGSGSRAAQFGLDVAGVLRRAAFDPRPLLSTDAEVAG